MLGHVEPLSVRLSLIPLHVSRHGTGSLTLVTGAGKAGNSLCCFEEESVFPSTVFCPRFAGGVSLLSVSLWGGLLLPVWPVVALGRHFQRRV